MIDSVASFITSVRNAYLAKKATLTVPYSKIKYALAKILTDSGYLKDYSVSGQLPFKTITLTLRYQGKLSALSGIKQLSTPGRRLYSRSHVLKPVLGGTGLTIVSTPKGLLTNIQAKAKHLGGELICQVW